MPAAVAVVAGVAAIGSAVAKSRAAKKASKARQKEAELGITDVKGGFEETEAALIPWQEAGAAALEQYSDVLGGGFEEYAEIPGGFEADPGYQFRLEEGKKAIINAATARSGLQSGQAGKELLRYGQEYASAEYGKVFNRYEGYLDRLSGLSGMGAQVAGVLGGFRETRDVNIANLRQRKGEARASGYLARGEAISGGIEGVGQAAASYFGGGGGGFSFG